MAAVQEDILSDTSMNQAVYNALSASVSVGSGLSATQFIRPTNQSSYQQQTHKLNSQQHATILNGAKIFSPVNNYFSNNPREIFGSVMGASRLQQSPQRLHLDSNKHFESPVVHPRLMQNNVRQFSSISGTPSVISSQVQNNQRFLSPTSVNGGDYCHSFNSPQYHQSSRMSVAGSSMIGSYTPQGQRIIGEYMTERVQQNQRKILVEETYEEVVVVPHKKIVEKYIDEPSTIRQRIVEVESPQIMERTVEVPQFEYVEVPQHYNETVYMDNVIMKPKIERVERVVEVPKIVYQDKIVQISVPEYREVEHETFIEVPEERIETKIIPKYIPQYVDIDVPEVVDVTEYQDVDQNIPVPLEHQIHVDLRFPKISPKYNCTEVPVYVPRFVEVPIAMDKLDDITLARAQEAMAIIESLQTSREPVPLAQLEAAVRQIVAQDWSVTLAGIESAEVHPWVSNFMSSQIPVLLDAVVQVTSDIQSLGLSQSAASVSSTSVSVPEASQESAEHKYNYPIDSDDEIASRQMSIVEEAS